MVTLLDLYNLRREITVDRQNDYLLLYEQLHTCLTGLHEPHPYNLKFNLKMVFEKLIFYTNASSGPPASIPVNDGFLYRICSIRDIVKGTQWRDDKGSDLLNWDDINKAGRDKWVSLSRFASGTYKCRPRHFSWWTTFPLAQDVITGAHRIGMTNDWVAEQCVVLRCPVDYVKNNKLAFVPSVIDAFMQMIFHPMRYSTPPPHGITIDLSLYPLTLCPGTDEIVLPELEIDNLEALAIYANATYREKKNTMISDNGTFLDLLKYYYENLLR